MSEYLQKYKVAFKGTHRVGTMINNDKKVWPAKSGGPSVDVTIPFYVENNTNKQQHIFVSSARFPYISKSYDNKNYVDVNGDLEEVIQPGIKLYLKCKPGDESYSQVPSIIAPKVGGNIASLYYGNEFNGQTSVGTSYTKFGYLFINCDVLTDASELYLLEELPYSAYDSMFRNCTSLTNAPELPATTLSSNCYASMFYGCTSLTKAPELPATELTESCYRNMFYGCTSLTKAPELPGTSFNGYSTPFYGMFQGCTSLVEAPDILPFMNITDGQYYNAFYGYMFSGCTSLTKAPKLPATTLGSYCYYYMFSGCTSLTKAPELPATTLAENCYSYMFQNCKALVEAPELTATTLANYCYSGMFSGCTSLTKAPELTATTLANYCYSGMFSGCTSLTKAPELPATTLANYCYSGMFSDCTSLTSIYMMARNNITKDALGYGLPWPTNTYKEGTLTLYNQNVYNTIYNIYKDDYNFIGITPKYWTINYIN